ncbi:hypothetical protein ACFL54_06770 [Planctomycetota bacterium]
MKMQTVPREKLAEFNRLKREIDKRRGQITSLNKCINHHADRIVDASTPSSIGKEGKMLLCRIDSKRVIMQELTDLEKKIKKLK